MSEALKTLLAEVVDYAGLFPPAALDMPGAVAEYARSRESADAWMLGRFVLPANRLDEWSAAAPTDVDGWRWPLAVLAQTFEGTLRRTIDAFNARERSRAVIDTAEVRATTAREVPNTGISGGVAIFVEIPVADDPARLLDAIAGAGVRAKIRTGGVTPEAFPTAKQIARFVVRCIERDIVFKATAGLHHPLRAEYRLTYAEDPPHGTMFGFLNILLATALAREGMPEKDLVAALEERNPESLVVGRESLNWRGRAIDLGTLRATRTKSITGFGSCSFREPVEDLKTLHLL
ncbi:MAG TPA: hypothetical protein VHM30_01275 [Gemmatimonadaceae bacterium]|nr:hypothetical protein [Gemmatimonadaceae bacterium]